MGDLWRVHDDCPKPRCTVGKCVQGGAGRPMHSELCRDTLPFVGSACNGSYAVRRSSQRWWALLNLN